MRDWHKRLGAGTVGACLALAGVLPASATTARGWRIVYRVPADGYQIDGVTAPAANNAWAIGLRYSGRVLRSSFYLHWAGHGWRAVSVPRSAGFAPIHISSSSPDNVWVLGSTRTGSDAALVYDGMRWMKLVAPADGPLAVLAPNDVWVQGGSGCVRSGGATSCTTMVYHWDGTVWTSYSLPVYGLELVGAGGHVWFIAAADLRRPVPPDPEIGREAVFRWSGSRWQSVMAPDREIVGGIAAGVGRGGKLWLLAQSVRASRPHLDYWNGRRWSQFKGPHNSGDYPGEGVMSYDGHNGVWDGEEHWTGRRWIETAPRYPGATVFGIAYVAHIPGTASVWGVAQERSDNRNVIAVHGRLP